MIGCKFNFLTVIEKVGVDKYRNILYKCICDCGQETTVSSTRLKTGKIKGCVRGKHRVLKENAVKRHPLYRIYEGMKTRCYNKHHMYYEYYGGRGITVCDRWLESFFNFVEDMGERPKGLTLDRIDNEKGYYKENCKWSTMKEQSNNRRPNSGWKVRRKTPS